MLQSTSFAHVYRVYDHRQTQSNRVSLIDKTYKNCIHIYNHIYISNTIIPMNLILLSHNIGRHQVIHVLHLLVITSRGLAAILIGHNR